MDIWSLAVNGALFLCSGTAFVYGVARFFKKRVALFNQLVACALGCMMLGRLFNIVTLLTSGGLTSGFSVGKLGLIGGFMFLFSASFGQMNGLADGGEIKFRKYRLAALSAPVFVILSYAAVFFSSAGTEEKIVTALIMLILAQCSYFNLKHLIIPDVDMGIIRSIRGYNLTALLLTGLSCAELIAASFDGRTAQTVITALLCLTYLAVIPVLERGVNKWTI